MYICNTFENNKDSKCYQNVDKCYNWAYNNVYRRERDTMAQAQVNVRLDEELKKNFEATCKELGLSIGTAITIFAKKVCREQRIPFEISVDPFFSAENIAELERRISDVKSGRSTLKEHDLIEVE